MGAEEWLQRELLARRIVLMTGVLTAEWFLRKRWGLV